MLKRSLYFLLLFLAVISLEMECIKHNSQTSNLNFEMVLPRLPMKISPNQWNRVIGVPEEDKFAAQFQEFERLHELIKAYKSRTANFTTRSRLSPMSRFSQPKSLLELINKTSNAKKIITPLIINGLDATSGQFTYQVALSFTNTSLKNESAIFCGGSLIALNCVLTAAHCCVKKTGNATVRVIAGAVDLSKTSTCRQEISTTNFISHPNYNSKTLNNDICCIFLPRSFKNTECVAPICLANGTSTFENATATVSGYGKTEGNATGISYVLQHTNMSVIANSQCIAAYGNVVVNKSVVCCHNAMTDDTDTTSRTCSGDSGGPLVYYSVSRNESCQIGVVSFGPANPPCGPTVPTGFTRVTSFIPWLTSIKANFTTCNCAYPPAESKKRKTKN